MKEIAILFLSIFFETLPFLLLGSFLSALIEMFISEEKMASFFPKNIFLGSIVGVFLGFFLPACDCAVIPVSKKLIQKKVPISIAVSFMLASPIINPVVLLSTYVAFSKVDMSIFYYRLFFGILIAFIIGILMGIIFKNKNILKNSLECSCEKEISKKRDFITTIFDLFTGTGEELFGVLKYFMIGALIASMVQVFIPRSFLLFFDTYPVVSVLALMIFAYLISLCSNSDSFVGRSLLTTFGSSGVLAYLLLGPMIDIKNTIVLFGNYSKKFVITLIGFIFLFVFLFSLVVILI